MVIDAVRSIHANPEAVKQYQRGFAYFHVDHVLPGWRVVDAPPDSWDEED